MFRSVLRQSTRKPPSQQMAAMMCPPPPSAPSLPSVPICKAWIAAAEPGCCLQERPRLHTRPLGCRRRLAATYGTTRSLRRRTQEVHTGRTRYGGGGMRRGTEEQQRGRDKEIPEQSWEACGSGKQRVLTVTVHWRVPIQVLATILMTSQQKTQVRRPELLCARFEPCAHNSVQRLCFSPSDYPASDSSPTSQKKAGVSGSMIDRLRSPGTVRKLSLKMKKLPELRRKLSLRSSSRAHRQGNDSRVSEDESTSKNATSSSASSNQNVISRYHLDSSAPPARPPRRSSRGRSASKGGEQFTCLQQRGSTTMS